MVKPKRGIHELLIIVLTTAFAISLSLVLHAFVTGMAAMDGTATFWSSEGMYGHVMMENLSTIPFEQHKFALPKPGLTRHIGGSTPVSTSAWYAHLCSDTPSTITSTGVFNLHKTTIPQYEYSLVRSFGVRREEVRATTDVSVVASIVTEKLTLEDPHPVKFMSPMLWNKANDRPYLIGNEIDYTLYPISSTSVRMNYRALRGKYMDVHLNQLTPYLIISFNEDLCFNITFDESMGDYRVIPLKTVAEIEEQDRGHLHGGLNRMVLETTSYSSSNCIVRYECKFNKDVLIKRHEDGRLIISPLANTEVIILPTLFMANIGMIWISVDKKTVDKIFGIALCKSYKGYMSSAKKGDQCVMTYISNEKRCNLIVVPSLSMLQVGEIEYASKMEGNNVWNNWNCESGIYRARSGAFSVKYRLIDLPSQVLTSGNEERSERFKQVIEEERYGLPQPDSSSDTLEVYAKK